MSNRDNITLNLIAEYHHLSSFSVSLLNQKFVSAIVMGEFCEVLLKYVLSKYSSVSETPRTHNLKELFLLLKRSSNPNIRSKVQSLYDRISNQTQGILSTTDYTQYRYKEISQNKLNAIKEYSLACQELYIFILINQREI